MCFILCFTARVSMTYTSQQRRHVGNTSCHEILAYGGRTTGHRDESEHEQRNERNCHQESVNLLRFYRLFFSFINCCCCYWQVKPHSSRSVVHVSVTRSAVIESCWKQEFPPFFRPIFFHVNFLPAPHHLNAWNRLKPSLRTADVFPGGTPEKFW